jgi:hypothetical protein
MPAAGETKYTFEEGEDGLEIGSDSDVVMICKCGEDAEFPAGTAWLSQMLGGDETAVFDPPIPLADLFNDPVFYLTPRDGKVYVYWLHPADYDVAVKEIGARSPLRSGDDETNLIPFQLRYLR